MTLQIPIPGFGATAEYQVPGLPFATASNATNTAKSIDFPFVTRTITISNAGSSGQYLYVGFTKNGVNGGNHFELNGGAVVQLELRVKQLWVLAPTAVNFSLLAGLTAIPSSQMLTLTGSTGSSELGWPGIG